jgi:hypothetical protein
MEAQGERRYCSCSFTTVAVDGVSGQHHAPASLYPRGKDSRYPLDRRLDRPQSRYGLKRLDEKSSCLCRGSNLDRLVVNPVARHYTD